MEYFIVAGVFITIIAGTAYLYLSIYFDTKSYLGKVNKYNKIRLYKLNKKNTNEFIYRALQNKKNKWKAKRRGAK